MPNTWPIAEYTLAAIALIVVGYVAVALTRRKNGDSKKTGPDLVQVVDNNTEAMHDLTGMVSDLHDLMLQATTKQGTQLEEVVAHMRMRGGGGE